MRRGNLWYTARMVTVQDDLRTYRVRGRVAAMIVYLAEQAQRLNGFPRVRVEFNCAGQRSVVPKVELIEDALPAR